MFDEYNKEFDDALTKVVQAQEAFKAALKELHNDFHSLNDSESDTADLTQVDYFMEDMEGFMIDEIGTLRRQQGDFPDGYETYSSLEMANDNRHSYAEMGLKTGRG